jgi:protein tyrosine phosphatase (PTP) superfamily phosphohydrolase (DUF442 family)
MKRYHAGVACVAALTIGAGAGCKANETPREGGRQEIAAAVLGNVPNVHRLGNFWFSGQPGAADFQAVADAGFATVVDLRLSEEDRGFDEGDAVTNLDMAYVNVGFKTPESLTDDVFDELRSVLRDAEGTTTLVHCGSANRAGAAWLVYRVLDEGRSFEDGLAEARTIGLRTPEYEDRAKAYISERQEP